MELTKSELEIMNVIWDAKRPLTRGEILDLSVDKKWKDNSIHILLNRLLEKGAIIEGGFARSGKSYGRLYEPNITGVDFYAENVLSGGDQERLEMLFDALLKRPDIDADMIKKFESKLEEKKKERKTELANVNWLGNVSEGNMEYISFNGKRYGQSSYILTFTAPDGEYGVRVLNPNDKDEKAPVFFCFGIHSTNE